MFNNGFHFYPFDPAGAKQGIYKFLENLFWVMATSGLGYILQRMGEIHLPTTIHNYTLISLWLGVVVATMSGLYEFLKTKTANYPAVSSTALPS